MQPDDSEVQYQSYQSSSLNNGQKFFKKVISKNSLVKRWYRNALKVDFLKGWGKLWSRAGMALSDMNHRSIARMNQQQIIDTTRSITCQKSNDLCRQSKIEHCWARSWTQWSKFGSIWVILKHGPQIFSNRQEKCSVRSTLSFYTHCAQMKRVNKLFIVSSTLYSFKL